MQPFDKIHKYTNTVCDQIRWKKAHAVISEEVENHLVDQRDAYIAEGMDDFTATDQAITQMGDAVVIGTELDRTHRPKPQWGMLILTMALVLIGAVIKVSFAYPGGYRWIAEFLFFQTIGLGLMVAAYLMDFTWFGRHARAFYLALLVYITGAFILHQMELRWFIFNYTSTIALLLPMSFAGVVYIARNKGCVGIVLCGVAFGLPALMLLQMRYRSVFILFAVSAFVILCLAIAKGWFKTNKIKAYLLVLIPTALALLLVAIIILNDSHKLEVIRAAFNPSYDVNNIDSYGAEIKMILGGSKFIGQGAIISNGRMYEAGYGTGSYLTSLIFYYGWISVMPILGAVLFFIVKGFRLCLKQKNGLALFISLAVMIIFTMQTIIYLLTNFGIDLVRSLSLPFVIQFNTYTYIIDLGLIGIMLSVFRTGHVVKDRHIRSVQNHRPIKT